MFRAKSGEQFIRIDEFAAIRLCDRLKEEPFLVGRHLKRRRVVVAENGYLFTFREGLSLDDDLPVRDGTGRDLHGVSVPLREDEAGSPADAFAGSAQRSGRLANAFT